MPNLGRVRYTPGEGIWHGANVNDQVHIEAAETEEEPLIAGRYKVDRLIARGGMAVVYLAHHVDLQRPVALKVLSPPPDPDETIDFEERFRLEAKTLASLDHRHIVILHDFGKLPDGRCFLAMEYVDGPRLTDLLKKGPMPAHRAVSIILQVCSALRYAHRRGVIHRDLKPSNLLLREGEVGEDYIKVVDFGLVKLTESDQTSTRAGLILGSPHCMAPEQVKGTAVDHRADIYALGVLLFRAVTGRYPFHGANSTATMVAHINKPLPTFYSVDPQLDVPPGLEEIVRTCMAKEPDDRYQDLDGLIDALSAVTEMPSELYKTGAHTFATMSRSQIHSQRRSNRVLLALSSTALVAVLVGMWAIFNFYQGQPQAPEVAAAPIEATPEADAKTEPAAEEPAEEAVAQDAVEEKPVEKAKPKAKPRTRSRRTASRSRPTPEPAPAVATPKPVQDAPAEPQPVALQVEAAPATPAPQPMPNTPAVQTPPPEPKDEPKREYRSLDF